jgi:hypothetical protein
VKRFLLSLLVLLALCWTAVTIITAVVRGEGHGAVFIAALCVLGVLCLGLLVLLRRVRRLDR